MSDAIHPAAPHFLPWFITAPGETDYLFTGVAVFLVVMLLVLGSLYFWLHSIPERLAHGASKHQFQLVAVMSLLALFTHNNAFWVAALLLALIPIPDFWTPLAVMADSLAKMAGRRLRSATADETPVTAQEEGAGSTRSSTHAAIASLTPPEEIGVAASQPNHGPVASAASTEGADDTLPGSGTETSAAEAKAAGNRRRALSKQGA